MEWAVVRLWPSLLTLSSKVLQEEVSETWTSKVRTSQEEVVQFAETWKVWAEEVVEEHAWKVQAVEPEEAEELEEMEEPEETEEAKEAEVMVQAEGMEHRGRRCCAWTLE